MSVAITTLNYLTMLALREGGTLVGENILDNPVDPFPEETITKPTIAVYVGVDTREDVNEHGLFGAPHSVELSIQTFVPATMNITVDGVKHRISSRGNGLQFVLGVLGGQIDTILSRGDSEAAQLWRILVGGAPKKVTVSPWLMNVKGEKGGIRIPAVERLLDVDILADPFFGDDEISEFWARVIALFSADEEFAPIAGMITALATGGSGLPVWRVAQAQLGLTEEGASAMGLTPFLGHAESDADEAAGLVEITLDSLGLTADDVLPPEPPPED